MTNYSERGSKVTQFEIDSLFVKGKLETWADALKDRFTVTKTEGKIAIGSLEIDYSAAHSSTQEMRDAKVNKKRDENVDLYFVYPWDSPNIDSIISHFNSKLHIDPVKLSARRLAVAEVSNDKANAFAKANHIQKSASGPGKISYALTDKKTGEIMAVQQYCKSRWSLKAGDPGVWEGLRLVIKNGVQIHGAATRLQKAFITAQKPNKLMSYVDYSHSLGGYKATQGFTLETIKGDSYKWMLSTDKPVDVMIIDKDGNERHPELDKVLTTPYINPNQMAGSFGKGVGQTFYEGKKLGSRAQLKAQGNALIHNDVILEAIGYKKVHTAGQLKWTLEFEKVVNPTVVEADLKAVDPSND
jgi:hypothetical protein